jgi:hypothetical protein
VSNLVTFAKSLKGLTSFTAPYFINRENLNWGAKYAYFWAGSNLVTFGRQGLWCS